MGIWTTWTIVLDMAGDWDAMGEEDDNKDGIMGCGANKRWMERGTTVYGMGEDGDGLVCAG